MRISDWSSDVCSSDLLPGGVADALEAEHRVVDVERQQLQVVGAVAGGAGEPAGECAGLGDAFLQHLARRVLAVVHQLVSVDRLVLLPVRGVDADLAERSEEHTSELQSLMRISYAVFCLKKKNKENTIRSP